MKQASEINLNEPRTRGFARLGVLAPVRLLQFKDYVAAKFSPPLAESLRFVQCGYGVVVLLPGHGGRSSARALRAVVQTMFRNTTPLGQQELTTAPERQERALSTFNANYRIKAADGREITIPGSTVEECGAIKARAKKKLKCDVEIVEEIRESWAKDADEVEPEEIAA